MTTSRATTNTTESSASGSTTASMITKASLARDASEVSYIEPPMTLSEQVKLQHASSNNSKRRPSADEDEQGRSSHPPTQHRISRGKDKSNDNKNNHCKMQKTPTKTNCRNKDKSPTRAKPDSSRRSKSPTRTTKILNSTEKAEFRNSTGMAQLKPKSNLGHTRQEGYASLEVLPTPRSSDAAPSSSSGGNHRHQFLQQQEPQPLQRDSLSLTVAHEETRTSSSIHHPLAESLSQLDSLPQFNHFAASESDMPAPSSPPQARASMEHPYHRHPSERIGSKSVAHIGTADHHPHQQQQQPLHDHSQSRSKSPKQRPGWKSSQASAVTMVMDNTTRKQYTTTPANHGSSRQTSHTNDQRDHLPPHKRDVRRHGSNGDDSGRPMLTKHLSAGDLYAPPEPQVFQRSYTISSSSDDSRSPIRRAAARRRRGPVTPPGARSRDTSPRTSATPVRRKLVKTRSRSLPPPTNAVPKPESGVWTGPTTLAMNTADRDGSVMEKAPNAKAKSPRIARRDRNLVSTPDLINREKSPANRRQQQRFEQRQRLQAALDHREQRQKEIIEEQTAQLQAKQTNYLEVKETEEELEEQKKEPRKKKGLFNAVAKVAGVQAAAKVVGGGAGVAAKVVGGAGKVVGGAGVAVAKTIGVAPTTTAHDVVDREHGVDSIIPVDSIRGVEASEPKRKPATSPTRAIKKLLKGPGGGKKKEQGDDEFIPLKPPSMMALNVEEDHDVDNNDDIDEAVEDSSDKEQEEMKEAAVGVLQSVNAAATKKAVGRRGRRQIQHNATAGGSPNTNTEIRQQKQSKEERKDKREGQRPGLTKETSKRRVGMEEKGRVMVKKMSQRRLAIEDAKRASVKDTDGSESQDMATELPKIHHGCSDHSEKSKKEDPSQILANSRTILMKARQTLNYESLLDRSTSTDSVVSRRHSIPPRSSTIVQLSDLEGLSSRSCASVSSHATEMGIDEEEYIQLVTETVGARTPRKSIVGTEFDFGPARTVGDVASVRTKKRRPKKKEGEREHSAIAKGKPTNASARSKSSKGHGPTAQPKSDLHGSSSRLCTKKPSGSSSKTSKGARNKTKRPATKKRTVQDDLGTVETSHKETLKERQSRVNTERMATSLPSLDDDDDEEGGKTLDFTTELGHLLEPEPDVASDDDELSTIPPATWNFGEPSKN